MSTAAEYRKVLRKQVFRRFFLGEAVSSVGDAMSDITVLLFAITFVDGGGAAMTIAFASAAYLAPGMLTGVLAGRALGAYTPRTLLMVDNVWRGSMLATVAVLAVAGVLAFPGYLALLALASLTRPLGAAGTRSLLPRLVEKPSRFTANSLLALAVQTASMAGPALAGVLVAVTDATFVLGLDAATFLFYAVLLLTIRQPVSMTAEVPDVTAGLQKDAELTAETAPTAPVQRRGVSWLRDYPAVASLLLLTAVFFTLYGPFVVGLPLVADRYADASGLESATLLGFLWSAFGVGAVIGGVLAGGRRSLARFRVAALISSLWGLATLVVALPTHLAVALAAMFLGGFVYAPYGAILSTVMQDQLPEDRLKEASAYHSTISSSAIPLGTLVGGAVIAWAGVTAALVAAGVLLIAVGVTLALLVEAEQGRTGPAQEDVRSQADSVVSPAGQ